MAIIPIAQQFHTLSSTVDTVDHGSAEFQSQRHIYTMQDIINTVSATGGSIDGSGAQYALPVFTDTNTITNLPLGVAGQLLTSGGGLANPLWADAVPGVYEVGAGADSAQLIGDASNTAVGDCSGVLSGHDNDVVSSAGCSVIVGGSGNLATGLDNGKGTVLGYQSVGGGQDNCLYGSYDVISGGNENVSCGIEGKDGCYGFNVIGGGAKNELYGFASVIGGGEKNYVACFSDPGKGASGYGTIGGGMGNCLGEGTTMSTIAGGMFNVIESGDAAWMAASSIIAGGEESLICVASNSPYTSGGNPEGKNSSILGGSKNVICNDNFSTIGGGSSNQIRSDATYSAACSFIGGGNANYIRGEWGVIGGGSNNDICGCYSSIIGGDSNDTSTFVNTHIVGSNITATQAGTTYVNALNISPLTGIPVAADNAAALLLANVQVGSLYRSGGDPDVVYIAH